MAAPRSTSSHICQLAQPPKDVGLGLVSSVCARGASAVLACREVEFVITGHSESGGVSHIQDQNDC